MAPVSYLMEDYDVVQKEAADCQERILDLCAAPGGKSTQIAARMHEMYTSGKWKEQGLLICNEIHPARAKILSENVERMGIANAMVTNETPQRLARCSRIILPVFWWMRRVPGKACSAKMRRHVKSGTLRMSAFVPKGRMEF